MVVEHVRDRTPPPTPTTPPPYTPWVQVVGGSRRTQAGVNAENRGQKAKRMKERHKDAATSAPTHPTLCLRTQPPICRTLPFCLTTTARLPHLPPLPTPLLLLPPLTAHCPLPLLTATHLPRAPHCCLSYRYWRAGGGKKEKDRRLTVAGNIYRQFCSFSCCWHVRRRAMNCPTLSLCFLRALYTHHIYPHGTEPGHIHFPPFHFAFLTVADSGQRELRWQRYF